jgi:signal transduction histidine kinase
VARSLGTGSGADGEVFRALAAVGIRSVMAVPVRLRETTLGAFVFGTIDPEREYGETDISTAEVVAQRAAKAIDNGRLHREIQRLATHEQERAAELESVVRTIGEGIVVCGEDGETRVVNQAARRMLGGGIADTDELRLRLGEHGGSLPAPGVPFGPAEFHVVDSPTTWVELTAYPVQTADSESGDATNSSATVYVLRDVTAFRQGQNLREAFLGLLSHELRTPVTTIYAAANVLGRPTSTLDEETRQEILGDMVAESNRLYRLVEDLMVLARFDERIELVRDPSLVQHLIPAVLESERTRWPQVTFVFAEPPALPAVGGDDTSIQQVLRNMLSNAAKYSPLGSTVTVLADEETGGVVVRVLDEGPGIEPDEAEELFDPFYRSPTTSAMASGAGIGLYVSRRLVDAMGGRIWARRRKERGSEFGFWLPQFVANMDGPEVAQIPVEVGGSLDTHL